MRIVRTVFQESEKHGLRLTLVVDMEAEMGLSTANIPAIVDKVEAALPGIFPDARSPIVHSCGSSGLSFRDELERGTGIPHLLEHIILYLLSRRANCCSAFCGRRSRDIKNGINSYFYIVVDCLSQIEAVVATEIALGLVSAWIENRTVTLDPTGLLNGIREVIEPMVGLAVTSIEQ